MKSTFTKERQMRQVVKQAISKVREIAREPLKKPLKGRGYERDYAKMDLRDKFQKKLFDHVPFSRKTVIFEHVGWRNFKEHIAYDPKTAQFLKKVLVKMNKIKNS